MAVEVAGRLREMVLLPKPKRPDYAWIHAHVSKAIHEAVARVARDEDRSISGTVARLLKEALRTRGIDVDEETARQEEAGDE